MEEFFESLLYWRSDLSAWSLPSIQITDVIDIIVIAALIYAVLNWTRRRGAWIVLRGVLILIVAMAVAYLFDLKMTYWIFQTVLSVGLLAVIVIFQPELRRGLEMIGRGKYFAPLLNPEKEEILLRESIDELIDACERMSAVKTGALICIEQKMPLMEYAETGISIDAEISSQLLINIFEKNTPLHDGAVIISYNRIMSATCYLPLSENPEISKALGTRHRAAIGLSEASDSKVLVVSEETGRISMAKGGELFEDIDANFIRRELLGRPEETEKKSRIPFLDKLRKKAR